MNSPILMASFTITSFILIIFLTFNYQENIYSGFTIKTYIPTIHKEFQNYINEISNLMGECFNNNNYIPPIDDHLWIMILSDSTLIGFLMIDSDNTIWNLCVSKNYRGKQIASHAVNFAIDYICKQRKTSPTLLVKNSSEDYHKLIHLYEKLGFETQKQDEKFTHMIYNCPKHIYV